MYGSLEEGGGCSYSKYLLIGKAIHPQYQEGGENSSTL